MRTFTSPQTSLGNLDTASVARLVGAASDVTVVMDCAGVILDTAFQSGQLGCQRLGTTAYVTPGSVA